MGSITVSSAAIFAFSAFFYVVGKVDKQYELQKKARRVGIISGLVALTGCFIAGYLRPQDLLFVAAAAAFTLAYWARQNSGDLKLYSYIGAVLLAIWPFTYSSMSFRHQVTAMVFALLVGVLFIFDVRLFSEMRRTKKVEHAPAYMS